MSDAAYAYRPGTRPAAAPSRPDNPRLHVVPPVLDDSELPTSGNAGSHPTQTISAGQSGSATQEQNRTSDSDFRVRTVGLWESSKAYWSPPAVFTDRPSSLDELRAYAKHAPWTAQQAGIVRTVGVGYYRLFAYPYTVWSRYKEWFAQRPGRLLPALGVIKVASLTGPGDWVVHTIVYPAAHLAGRIFL